MSQTGEPCTYELAGNILFLSNYIILIRILMYSHCIPVPKLKTINNVSIVASFCCAENLDQFQNQCDYIKFHLDNLHFVSPGLVSDIVIRVNLQPASQFQPCFKERSLWVLLGILIKVLQKDSPKAQCIYLHLMQMRPPFIFIIYFEIYVKQIKIRRKSPISFTQILYMGASLTQ